MVTPRTRCHLCIEYRVCAARGSCTWGVALGREVAGAWRGVGRSRAGKSGPTPPPSSYRPDAGLSKGYRPSPVSLLSGDDEVNRSVIDQLLPDRSRQDNAAVGGCPVPEGVVPVDEEAGTTVHFGPGLRLQEEADRTKANVIESPMDTVATTRDRPLSHETFRSWVVRIRRMARVTA